MSRARPRKNPVWEPGPEHLALVPPGASGNAVNGLGETVPRRATPVACRRRNSRSERKNCCHAIAPPIGPGNA